MSVVFDVIVFSLFVCCLFRNSRRWNTARSWRAAKKSGAKKRDNKSDNADEKADDTDYGRGGDAAGGSQRQVLVKPTGPVPTTPPKITIDPPYDRYTSRGPMDKESGEVAAHSHIDPNANSFYQCLLDTHTHWLFVSNRSEKNARRRPASARHETFANDGRRVRSSRRATLAPDRADRRGAQADERGISLE